MVSIGNKAKLVDSETCQKCAKCCKIFNYLDNLDMAIRFMWMGNEKIQAKDTPFRFYDGVECKEIRFNIPCTHLKEKKGKYSCDVYDKERPDFCNTYPDHVFYPVENWNIDKIQKILDHERNICVGLKKVTVNDVVKMLKEHRKEL